MLSLSSRPLRRPSAALTLALGLTLAAPLPALAQGEPATAEALYGERMDKGLKLFQDKNYDAAIAEFYAAYKVNPRAAPLINIALSYKAQFKYAKAVAVLEEALEKHADTLDARDRRAAEAAIKELSSLLAHVTVKLSPPHARLMIDGEEVPSASLSKPVALPTGPHVLRASAEGHAPVEKKIEVVSGQEDTVELKLVPTGGHVTIEADDPRTPIFVDNQQIGFGRWAGVLPTGPHIIEFRPPGAAPQIQRIQVAPGSATAVRPEAVTSSVSPLPLGGKPGEKEFTRRGAYLLGVLSTFSPDIRATDGLTFSTGLRIGYQLGNVVGFELSAEYGFADYNYFGRAHDVISNISYDGNAEISSLRLGPNIRLTSPGRSVRFLSSFGIGYVNSDINYTNEELNLASGSTEHRTVEGQSSHNSLYFQNELGVEFEFAGFLLDLVVQNHTIHYADIEGAPDPGLHVGWGVRLGRGFW